MVSLDYLGHWTHMENVGTPVGILPTVYLYIILLLMYSRTFLSGGTDRPARLIFFFFGGGGGGGEGCIVSNFMARYAYMFA